MTPSLSFVRPASVHRFDGSLTMVFWLILFFIRTVAGSEYSLLAAAQLQWGQSAVGIHLVDVMLDHVVYLSICKDGIVQDDCLLCWGSMLRLLPQVFFPIHTSLRLVSWALKHVWSAPRCRTSSGKVMSLSKSGYMLYPLGLTAFALNSEASQTGDSCWKSPKRTTKRFPNGLSL